MQEDWRDFVAAFYFPKQRKLLTDDKIREFVERTNSELCEDNQQPHVINLIVAKAIRFFENNLYIIENLLQTLKEENMFEAVLSIARHTLKIGRQR